MPIFACYDATGIQRYIFASNKLSENVGASLLVRNVLRVYLPAAIQKTLGANNVITDWKERLILPLDLSKRAEIIYEGGGNAYVAFADYNSYEATTKCFLRDIYDKTAGIGIAAAYVETDMANDYAAKFAQLQNKFAEKKSKINRPVPAGNQPITRASRLTGLPVTRIKKYNGEYEMLSEDQFCKREARDNNKDGEQDEPLQDFNSLERGNSYLALIHADGNNMGKTITPYCSENNWEAAIPQIRTMSRRITELYGAAYSNTKNKFENYYQSSKYFKDNNKLPIIDIINDGDDITCVLAGQFGLSFAAELLREIERIGGDADYNPFPENNIQAKITACAGVAIFHSHFPFSSAYNMAEECCGNAKKFMREINKQGSFIDFHLHQSGMITTMKAFRNQQYTTESGILLHRPWCVSAGDEYNQYPSFNVFEKLQAKWVNDDRQSKMWPRSRLISFRNALGKSDSEAEEILRQCASRGYLLPEWPKSYDIKKSKYSALFDVLELSDVYENICGKEAVANVHNN